MIAPLRHWHLRIWLCLAVLLPLLFILALCARPEKPIQQELPEVLSKSDVSAAGEAP